MEFVQPIRECKTGKSKDFPISTSAKKAIIEYLSTRNYKLNEPLFISQKSNNGLKSINRQRAYKVINDAARGSLFCVNFLFDFIKYALFFRN